MVKAGRATTLYRVGPLKCQRSTKLLTAVFLKPPGKPAAPFSAAEGNWQKPTEENQRTKKRDLPKSAGRVGGPEISASQTSIRFLVIAGQFASFDQITKGLAFHVTLASFGLCQRFFDLFFI